MGMREEIQADLAEAFDTDLADAVVPFTGSYQGPGIYDPVEETTTAVTVTYTGRGVMDGYESRQIDGINILIGDLLLICLVSELAEIPAVGHAITADDLLTGEPATYYVVKPGVDPAKAHYELQLRKT